MRLAVFGGTGRTGGEVVRAAMLRGHEVTALARRPAALAAALGSDVRVVAGDVRDPDAVRRALAGSDAVVSAIGSATGRGATDVYSAGVSAMLAAGASRIVAVSAIPAAPDDGKSLLERRVVHALLGVFFGGSYADMRRMEALLAGSDAAWTVVRPPRLTDGAGTGAYRVAAGPLPRARSVSRADLAAALLDIAADATAFGQYLTVAH